MINRDIVLVGFCVTLALSSACSGSDAPVRIGNSFVATPVANFEEPWAMTFLPDGRLLVTEKKGALKLLNLESKLVGDISGVPEVAYGGQGGFGDVILHPQYAGNSIVYVSYSEPGDEDTNGAAVARAKLALDNERRRQARRFQSDLAPGAQGGQPRSLGPSPRLRTRWQVVDHLGRAPAVHAGAGHEEQPRQSRAAQRRRLGARGQSFLCAGRRHRADLVARPSQPVRHRVRAGRQAVRARDGPERRRRAQRHRERRELRLSRSSRTAITTMAATFPIIRRGPNSRRRS